MLPKGGLLGNCLKVRYSEKEKTSPNQTGHVTCLATCRTAQGRRPHPPPSHFDGLGSPTKGAYAGLHTLDQSVRPLAKRNCLGQEGEVFSSLYYALVPSMVCTLRWHLATGIRSHVSSKAGSKPRHHLKRMNGVSSD